MHPVVQEFAREGVVPYSSVVSSNKPFNAPLPGLAWQWVVSTLVMFCAPPGDAYLFLLNRTSLPAPHSFQPVDPPIVVSSYPLAVINAIVAIGLILLYTPSYRSYDWNPPFHTYKWAIAYFLLANILLVVVPLVPPVTGTRLYENLPYWVCLLGAVNPLELC